MDMKQIGDFLAALRKAKGMTQQNVADYLHMSNKTVSKWERGDGLPELGSLLMLAELYDVTTDEILRGGKGKTDNAKTTHSNATYLVKKIMRQFDTYTTFAKLLTFLGYIALITIGYATYNSAIASGVSIGMIALGGTFLWLALIKLQSVFDYMDESHALMNQIRFKRSHQIFLHSALTLFFINLSLPIFVNAQAHAIYSARYYSEYVAMVGPVSLIFIGFAYLVFRKIISNKGIKPFINTSKSVLMGMLFVMLIIPYGVNYYFPVTEAETRTVHFDAGTEAYDLMFQYRDFHQHRIQGGDYDIVTVDGNDYYAFIDPDSSMLTHLSVEEGEHYLNYLDRRKNSSWFSESIRIEYYEDVPIPITAGYYVGVFFMQSIFALAIYGVWVLVKKH